MEGRLDPIIDALTTHYQAEKLKHQGGNGTGATRLMDVRTALLQAHAIAGGELLWPCRG